jgi:hypothetical protein
MKTWVRYRVGGFPQELEAGPYADVWEAEQHERDIRGYEGVSDVYLSYEPLRCSNVDDEVADAWADADASGGISR